MDKDKGKRMNVNYPHNKNSHICMQFLFPSWKDIFFKFDTENSKTRIVFVKGQWLWLHLLPKIYTQGLNMKWQFWLYIRESNSYCKRNDYDCYVKFTYNSCTAELSTIYDIFGTLNSSKCASSNYDLYSVRKIHIYRLYMYYQLCQ